ncbi:MAG: 30S ribosomal protein S17 [Acidobacteriota bacterium]|nr:30S ribosomal protein S17 [Acidobacteriota bacterium]
MPETKQRGAGQTKVGVVVSKSGAKTVKIRVQRMVKHPVYKRYVRSTKGFLAHDQRDECEVGDQVEIVESRPLSARKRWRVRRIVARHQERALEARPAARGA